MIIIQTKISQDYLSQLINAQLDQIFDQNTGETNKVTVALKRNGTVAVALLENDVLLSAPLEVTLKKGDGLFTAEANGAIAADIKIEVNIDEELRTSTHTSITGYKWLEKPRLDIGIFDIPVEKLTDLGLKYYEPSICGAIDAKLKPLLNFNQMIDENLNKLQIETSKHLPEGVHVQVIPKSFVLENFNTQDGNICINLGLDPILQITSEVNKTKVKKQFRWVDQLDKQSLGFVHFTLEEESLKSIMFQQMQSREFGGREVNLTQLYVQTDPQFLALVGELDKPIESTFTLKTGIHFNEHEQRLYVKDLDLKVKPKSFIHKLGAPLFASFIESQIEELFPLDVNKVINDFLDKLKPFVFHQKEASFKIDFQRVKLNELLVTDPGIEGVMEYQNLNIEVLVGGQQVV